MADIKGCFHWTTPYKSSEVSFKSFRTVAHTLLQRTLQHTATHCNTLQHTATHCNTLQHTATHYNTLQHTTTHCNTLQHSKSLAEIEGCLHFPTQWKFSEVSSTVISHCSTLQHTATHFSHCRIHYTTTHCPSLPHTATPNRNLQK